MSNVTIALPPDVIEITDDTPFTPQRRALAVARGDRGDVHAAPRYPV